MMLPDFFPDWWFSPWAYARRASTASAPGGDMLARRDGYRLWCSEAGVLPDLPEAFDAGWSIAATTETDSLVATARLFAGLIATREHDRDALDALSFADRKWCASIASTQPLQACGARVFSKGDTIEVRGVVELARRLDAGFPGMWPRLRLLLPEPMEQRTSLLLEEASGFPVESSSLRAQRCWRMCRDRVALEQKDEPRHSFPAAGDGRAIETEWEASCL